MSSLYLPGPRESFLLIRPISSFISIRSLLQIEAQKLLSNKSKDIWLGKIKESEAKLPMTLSYRSTCF
jgi:hypothetical protein